MGKVTAKPPMSFRDSSPETSAIQPQLPWQAVVIKLYVRPGPASRVRRCSWIGPALMLDAEDAQGSPLLRRVGAQIESCPL